MAKAKELALPGFYDPNNAALWDYGPNVQSLFEAAAGWRKQFSLQPAAMQSYGLHLLIIDQQKDFCFPQGTLYVGGRSGTGAIDDSRRITEFIYRNLGLIKNISTTLDTHFTYQIFFPSFWVDSTGAHPAPHTLVKLEDVTSGKLAPNPAVAGWLCNGNYGWLCKQVQHYCAELQRAGKYTLYLWPFHCLAATPGNALVGLVEEARLFHSFVRSVQTHVEVKGGHPLTENYSVISPEVLTRFDGRPLAQKNTAFIKTLIEAPATVVVGEADSHCVLSTMDGLIEEIYAVDPELAKKLYFMTDCSSAVVVPGVVDYTPQAEAAHQRFADKGLNLVKSTDPVASWPGIQL